MMPFIVEIAAAAAWNYKGNPKWDKIPEAWKPFYREQMAAALGAVEDAAWAARQKPPKDA